MTPEELAAYQDWSELDHEGNDDGEAVYQSCFAAGLAHARAESAKELASLTLELECAHRAQRDAENELSRQMARAAMENGELKAQVAGLRKDAERYRIDAEDSLEHARQLVILLQTIEGSLKTHSAAEVLDENSPIREAIRDAIPFQLQPSDRIVKEKSAIDAAIEQEKQNDR